MHRMLGLDSANAQNVVEHLGFKNAQYINTVLEDDLNHSDP